MSELPPIPQMTWWWQFNLWPLSLQLARYDSGSRQCSMVLNVWKLSVQFSVKWL